MRPSSRNLFLWNLKLQFPKITTNRDINNRTQTKEYDLHHRIAFSRKTIEGSLFYKHIYETNKHELSLNGIFSHTKDSRPSTYQIDDILTLPLPETRNRNSSACKWLSLHIRKSRQFERNSFFPDGTKPDTIFTARKKPSTIGYQICPLTTASTTMNTSTRHISPTPDNKENFGSIK